MSDVRISNFGISTGDLDASVRFYTEGLGFEAHDGWKFGDVFAAAAEVQPPMRARSQLLTKDGFTLQLLAWTSPEVERQPGRPRNVAGLTHLALMVDDLAAAEARLVALGGTVIEATRTEIPGAMKIVCITDPNGVKLELVETA